MLCQKKRAKLSQGSKQMLQIAINPFPNAIFLSLSYLFLTGYSSAILSHCQYME